MKGKEWIGGWLLIAAFVVTVLKVCTKPERIDTFITNDYVIDTVNNDFVKKFDTIDILRATTYNAVAGQCDSTPFNTADGSFINSDLLYKQEIRWVALSRDLIKDRYRDGLYTNRNHWRGYFKFGDTITVSSDNSPQIDGKWVVHDCMAPRYERCVDFLFDPRNNNPKLGVCTDLKIMIENK